MVNACEVCTKSVYPLEAIVIQEKTYHKICFKCQDPDCGIQLNLKTAQSHVGTGKVYCAKHYPKEKATAVSTSVELERAKNAPKLATVNQQKRGEGMENPTVTQDSLHIQNAKNAPKLATVNEQKRGDSMENPNFSSDSLQIQNAKNAPKLATVNEQKRGDSMENPNFSSDSLLIQNAKNAPKLATVNEQKRGDSMENPTVTQDSLHIQNAKNAPKLATVNEQKRGDSMENPTITNDSLLIQNAKNSQQIAQNLHNENVRGTGDVPSAVIGLQMENALNAPKLGTVNPQLRAEGMDSPSLSHDSIAFTSAKNATNISQRLFNETIRGTGDVPTSSIHDISIEKALNAPKVEFQSPNLRGTGEKPNFNIVV